jgi:hypothetical protein
MQKFSCKEFCKKTSQLRNSEFCTSLCENVDGKLVFGCEQNLKSLSVEVNNFLSCYFWDIGLKDNCSSCPLPCPENKNETVFRAKAAIKNVSNILESLGPIISMSGIDSSFVKKAYDSANSSNINTNNSKEVDEAIKIANYARDIINKVMSGEKVDVIEFRKIKEDIEKKYKK